MSPSSEQKRERPTGPQHPGPVAASDWTALPAAPARVTRRRPAAGRKPALSVPVIVAAAIEVLDEAGFAGLSMRRVADRLGTGAASLYAHVSGREELLELVFDALVGQVRLEEPDPARVCGAVGTRPNSSATSPGPTPSTPPCRRPGTRCSRPWPPK